jgi:hypothetical protein
LIDPSLLVGEPLVRCGFEKPYFTADFTEAEIGVVFAEKQPMLQRGTNIR